MRWRQVDFGMKFQGSLIEAVDKRVQCGALSADRLCPIAKSAETLGERSICSPTQSEILCRVMHFRSMSGHRQE